MRAFGLRASLAVLLFLAPAPLLAQPKDRGGMDFFEQKIRPVLVKECYSCHAADAKRVKGGLLLDTRDALRKGGDSGPALVPGKVNESLLIKALRHDGLEMPPKGKLPDAVIADFERWVKIGAPDPRDGRVAPKATALDVERGRKFWAFQPPRHFDPPKVADAAWPRSDIDRFILAKLEAKGIKPAHDADRLTLIRRATIDLTGLPPTPEEIDAFVNDPAADPVAFAKVVDRLLASPHFGERWGRHWLDVARYADSNGKDENLTFHEAWRYRDYVIQSFNEDKPFDRFIREQLAGDLMPASGEAQANEQTTGSGFLILGPKVLADRDREKRLMDVIDEQIETTGRAFMGLTLGCARCHDHKFDPVPQNDYYALAGIFLSTRTLDGFKLGNPVVSGWTLRPLGGPDAEAKLAAVQAHRKKLTDLTSRIKKAKADLAQQEDRAAMRQPGKLAGITVDDRDAKLVGAWKASTFTKPYVGAGYVHDDKGGKGKKLATFTPKLPKAGEYEVFVSYTVGSNRATRVPVTVKHAGGETVVFINEQEAPPVDGLFRSVGKYKFGAGEAGSVTIANANTDGYVIVDAVRFVPAGIPANDKEVMGVPEEVRRKIADLKEQLKKLETEEKQLKASAPVGPPLVMAPREADRPTNARINVRGNPHSLGAEVPRGFLGVVPAPRPAMPSDQSGRLQLAQWVASPENPLTARVFVNRVWSHLLGTGLVRTVDNFGTQGERPSHPELLDELAVRFVNDGWSVKKLVRSVVLSRTYQLACIKDEAAVKADPENRLFGRANRRRAEAEVIRDAILQVSGKLDRSMGGSAVASLGEQAINNSSLGGVQTDANVRRSVYLPVIRNELPQIFEVFDFADPDVSTGKRDVTTVATQALYLMNSPFVMEQSRLAAKRLLALRGDDAARLADLYRRALGRAPTPEETKAVLRFLTEARTKVARLPKGKNPADPEVEAWAGVCAAVFGCTEFRFVE